MREESKIRLIDLPYRAKKLNPEELTNVFGGCLTHGQFCIANSDCCGDFTCIIYTARFRSICVEKKDVDKVKHYG